MSETCFHGVAANKLYLANSLGLHVRVADTYSQMGVARGKRFNVLTRAFPRHCPGEQLQLQVKTLFEHEHELEGRSQPHGLQQRIPGLLACVTAPETSWLARDLLQAGQQENK